MYESIYLKFLQGLNDFFTISSTFIQKYTPNFFWDFHNQKLKYNSHSCPVFKQNIKKNLSKTKIYVIFFFNIKFQFIKKIYMKFHIFVRIKKSLIKNIIFK